ncbi:MAG TPA: hypothetical protein DEQ43_02100 [Nocardioides bacterium]|uniref:hypothetical protein n=1 Tax=uncultured Nocardioides sp. TaxID=198441 RepID=UPI000EDDCB33|nr:hypothetical protein [uncultured Nocardioides sp.]HCB03043.1 hypothetical protein [Nocardioides sp.]HRD62588.1 hypothetical protein [Nocardioides sp.]
MQIGRRSLLGLGAAAVISAATGCSMRQDDGGLAGPIAEPTPTTPPVPTPAAGFPGQPRPGQMYYGASVPYGRSLREWERELESTLALHRSYFKPDDNETGQLIHRCQDDLSHGRLPHVSIKPTWPWSDFANGSHDYWMDKLLETLGDLSAPLIFTLHHEPENDVHPNGREPADYVAMQRRLLERAASRAPEVIVAPVLQHWTFDPLRTDIDPSEWLVPEANVLGLDIYNPWSVENGKEWRSFGSKMDEVMGWFDGKPMVIGEYGCRNDPSNPGLSAEWLRDAAAYGLQHGFVSMSYFNSGVQSPDGTWALSGDMEQAFKEMLNSDWVARPA